MKTNNIFRRIIVSFMLLGILACSGTFTSTFSAPTSSVPTAIPSFTPAATPTQGQELILSSVPLHEENQNPNYQINAQVPTLQGSADPRVVNFNTTITNLINTEINVFKKNIADLSPAAYSVSPASSLDATYALVLQQGDLWSLELSFSVYLAGAAHPYDYTITVNYDVGQGRQLALSELFLPNSNYLEVISNYCITELKKQPYADSFSLQGASPTPENYRNWNITNDGLLITFDEGWVAANAAGAQKIVVPYSELQAMINSQGPLAGLAR